MHGYTFTFSRSKALLKTFLFFFLSAIDRGGEWAISQQWHVLVQWTATLRKHFSIWPPTARSSPCGTHLTPKVLCNYKNRTRVKTNDKTAIIEIHLVVATEERAQKAGAIQESGTEQGKALIWSKSIKETYAKSTFILIRLSCDQKHTWSWCE